MIIIKLSKQKLNINFKTLNSVRLNIPPLIQTDYSRLVLRIFLGVFLFISFSRCSGGGDKPEPDIFKSRESSISKISFTVNGKHYDASIAEETVTVMLPHGTTIPSQVTITTLEHSPKAVSSAPQGEVLKISNGRATIIITAEDGTQKMYTINFVILPSSEALISSLVLEISGESKTIAFDQNGNDSIVFPYGTTIPSQVTITTLEHSPKAVPSVPQGEILPISNGKPSLQKIKQQPRLIQYILYLK